MSNRGHVQETRLHRTETRSREGCNKISQDGVIVCHSSSTFYMMSCITFLQMSRHNFCNHKEQKRNRLFTRQVFLCVAKKWPGNKTSVMYDHSVMYDCSER